MAQSGDAREVEALKEPSAASTLYVSYREGDSEASVRRLLQRVEHVLGQRPKHESADAGGARSALAADIEDALKTCVAMIVVITPNWLRRLHSFGSESLEAPFDHVRWQIRTALKLDILLVPVLLDGASMPQEHELPNDIKLLAASGAQRSMPLLEDELETLPILLARPKGRIPLRVPRVAAGAAMITGFSAAVALLIAIAVFRGSRSGPPVDSAESLFGFVKSLSGENVTAGAGLVLLLVAGFLKALFAKYQEALVARFGDSLRDGKILRTVTVWLIVVAIAIVVTSIGRWVFATALVIGAAAVLAAQHWLPGLRARPLGFAMMLTGVFAALAIALWIDIAYLRGRDTAVVAFVLPPEGGTRAETERMFKETVQALRLTLQHAKQLELVPTTLTEEYYKRFEVFDGPTLLSYTAPRSRGYARMFIRTRYNAGPGGGIQRVVVAPEVRTDETPPSIEPLGNSMFVDIAGPSAYEFGALKIAFRVIGVIAAQKMLTDDELKKAWRRLLTEYRTRLLAEAACSNNVTQPETNGELTAGALERILFTACLGAASPNMGTAAPANTAVETATAPYKLMLGK